MVFNVENQNNKLVLTSPDGTVKEELTLPVTRSQIVDAAIKVAKQMGVAKFILKTSDGATWEDIEDIPDEVNNPMTVTVNSLNLGA